MLFSESGLDVYYISLSGSRDGMIGVRGDMVLFLFGITRSVENTNEYKGVDFESLEDCYKISFKVLNDYNYIVYITKNNYKVFRDEVMNLCIE